MQILDNINNTVRDDLKKIVHRGSKMSIAAACFSIYAYQELRKQLEEIEDLEFIFTSPTFITEKTPKAKREFYIPRLSRERSLYGTEFEVKLRNELTQKAIAKECAEWIEQEEDVLSYAQFPKVALDFFKKRRDAKYGIDGKHGDAEKQIHPV